MMQRDHRYAIDEDKTNLSTICCDLYKESIADTESKANNKVLASPTMPKNKSKRDSLN